MVILILLGSTAPINAPLSACSLSSHLDRLALLSFGYQASSHHHHADHAQPHLQPSTTCCVTMAAINMCNGTSYEGLGNTTCGRTLDTPPIVQNLSAVVLSPHSVSLTWRKQQQTGVWYTITSSLGTTNVSEVSSAIFEGLSQGVPSRYSRSVTGSYR